jgi:hypothetical protein
MTYVLAVDLAANTGWALGHVGAQPRFGSVRFGDRATHNNVIFAACLDWTIEILQRERPDLLILESLLPPTAKLGHTSAPALDRLAGLNAIVRAVAHRAQVGEIADAAVSDVRGHFIGSRREARAIAKRLTIERCRRLGWSVVNDNEADALALWSYACALIDPKTALDVVPLFNRRLAG